MKVEQIYTGCLAQGAYYIESEGEAAIIDPLREVEPYIELAKSRKATIKYVFETHFHADFVSGHVDLSKKTGAPIIYGPTTMKTGFDAIIATDGQEFPLGKAKVRLIHTPGHTMESSCYLLIDEEGNEQALFTGDTLFIGDVGRPDLAQKVIEDLTQEKLANHLFDSLRNKIMPLSDNIIVYPGHGAGSACGKMMSDETQDTLGNQKKTNYALNPNLTRAEFVDAVLTGLTPPPQYFPHNVLMNIAGYESIDEVVKKGTTPLSVREFDTIINETDAIILDTRDAQEFAKAFVPGSFNIGIDGSFANWVGTTLKDVKQKLVVITDEGKEEEVATRLARIGFDNNLGFLKGGVTAWKAAGHPVESIESVDVDTMLKEKTKEDGVLDVRRTSEYNSEHVVGAVNTPLDYLEENLSKVDKNKKYYVYCRSGYRSMAFASMLRAKGYDNLVDVKGGFEEIKASGKCEITEYVAPTTLL